MTRAERWTVAVGVIATTAAVLLGAGTVRRAEVFAILVSVAAFVGTVIVFGKARE